MGDDLGDSEALARELSTARQAAHRSLRDVADAAGISAAYLQKLERSQVEEPSPRILRRLATALGISYRRLMELAGYESASRYSVPGALTGVFAASGLTETEGRAVAAFIEHLKAQRQDAVPRTSESGPTESSAR